MCQLILSEFLASSPVLEIFGQRELHLDERDLFIGESQEVLDRSSFPSGFFKFLFLCFLHCLTRFVIRSESFLYSFYYRFWRFARLFAEHVGNYYCILIDSIYYSPGGILINDSQFVASSFYRRHWSRMRKTEFLAELELAKQKARFDASRLRKGRRSHFAFEPDERFILWLHPEQYMSYQTYCQEQILSQNRMSNRSSS